MTTQLSRSQFALAIGVTGHRLNRLPEAARAPVTAEVERICASVRRAAEVARTRHAEMFGAEPLLLSLVSSLAEGADRIAATAALGPGFVLDVLLPFAQDIYEREFADAASCAEFRTLLGKARSVRVLPGDPADMERAYEACGLAVLARSDVLLAVWDGGASAGPGGTADMVAAAARQGLPVIHVDADGRAPARLLWNGPAPSPMLSGRLGDLRAQPAEAALPELVEALVNPAWRRRT